MPHIAYLFAATPHSESVAEIASLRKQNVSAQLFSLTPHALDGLRTFPSPEPWNALSTARLRLPGSVSWETGLKALALAPQIRHFDHICAQDGEEAAYAAYALSYLTGVPFSFSTRDHNLIGYNPALAEVARHAAWIVTGSSHGLHALQELYGVPADRITVMPPSVDLNAFPRTTEPTSAPPRIVCAGPLNSSHEHIIRAIAALRLQGYDLRMDIVGEGANRAELEQFRDNCQLQGVVEFMGDVPQHYLRHMLQDAVMFIQPQASGSYAPAALLQAMAASLPIIAFEGELVNEWLENGHNAMLIPPHPARVAGSVAFLLRTPRTARVLGRSAREVVACRCPETMQEVYRIGLLTMRIGAPRRPSLSYLAVTHLQGHHIALEHTLKSVVAQSVRPIEWILVDDSACQHNRELAMEYASKYDWIRVQPAATDAGPGDVGAIYTAMASAHHDSYQVVVKVDVGVELDMAHMANLLLHLEDHSHVGIVSGQLYMRSEGRWLREISTDQHAFAPAKAFRRTCLDSMGGVPAVQFWDGLDELKARAHGWETGHVPSLPVFLHSTVFTPGSWWKMRVQQGRHAWRVGFGPHRIAARAIRRAATNPPLISSVALLAGYADAAMHKEPRLDDEVVQDRIRKEERERVLRRLQPGSASPGT